MPWPELIRAAILLGITPKAFWDLSVVEWRALIGGSEGKTLSPNQLKDLIAAFPDEEEHTL